MRTFHRKLENAADLAGSMNIYDPIVGRLLYKRLRESISALAGPSILIIDFGSVNLVDSSPLIISIAKLLALISKNEWNRTVVCMSATESQIACLEHAVVAWPDVADPWDEMPKQRFLLLASSREVDEGSTRIWHLLGELTELERELWDLTVESGCITIEEAQDYLGLDKETILSTLGALLHNRVLIWEGKEEQSRICAICSLLNTTQEK